MPNAHKAFAEHDAHKLRVVNQWRENVEAVVVELECGSCGYSSTLHINLYTTRVDPDLPAGVEVDVEIP